MANTIKIKRSAVQGKVPVVGDLSLGELALNTYDGKLYTLKNDGTASVIEIGASSGASFSTDISLQNQSASKYYEASANGTNYVAIRAPSALSADVTLTLPTTDGDADQVLATDGNGNLSWVSRVGGSGTSGDFLVSSTASEQAGYFGNIYLKDDSNASHYLEITNSADLTALRTLSINVNNANRTVSLSGNLTLANNLITSGNFALTLTTTAATNVTLPTSGTLATTGNLSQFAATTSAQLAGVISDETGSGSLVFANSPTLFAPVVNQLRISGDKSGTYSHDGTTTITVTVTNHGLTVGDSVYLDFTSLATGTVQPTDAYFNRVTTVANANTFTVTAGAQTAATGNVTIRPENQIRFQYQFGDGDTTTDPYNHTVISERLYGGADKSELLIFKGNDSGTTIQDNIRLAAAGDIYFHTGFAGGGMSYGNYINSFGNTITSSTLSILASGNVGVATVNPGAKFEVYGTSRFGGTTAAGRRVDISTDGILTLAYGNNTNSSNLIFQNVSDIGSTTNCGNSILWQFGTNTTTVPINAGAINILKEQQWTTTATTQDSYFSVDLALDGVVGEKIRVTSAGSVGIGTATPQLRSSLHIFNANSRPSISAPTLVIDRDANAVGDDYSYVQYSNSNLGSVYAGLTGTNQFGISITNPGGAGHTPYVTFGPDENVMRYHPLIIGTGTSTGTASQNLQVTGGAYVSGNLGVGVTAPAFKADIAGDARVTSTNKMRFGGTAGTTNFYIQYNSTTNSLDFVAG